MAQTKVDDQEINKQTHEVLLIEEEQERVLLRNRIGKYLLHEQWILLF
jgi:hypothetical protein